MEPHAVYNQAGPSNFTVPYAQEGRPPPSYVAGRGRGHAGHRHANTNYSQAHQAPFFTPGVPGSYAGYSFGLNGTTGPPLHGQYSHPQSGPPPGRRPGPSYHAANFQAPPSPALHPTHMYNPHASPYLSPTAVPSPGPMYPYPHAPAHLHPYPAPFPPPIHHPSPSFTNQNVKSPSTTLVESGPSSPKTWQIQQPPSPRPLQVSSAALPDQREGAPSPTMPLNSSPPPPPPPINDPPQSTEPRASSPSPNPSSPVTEVQAPSLPNSPPSPSVSLPSFDNEPAPQQEWVISAFRPDNPAAAFGIMISPKAKPPSHIVKGAHEYIPPARSKGVKTEPVSDDRLARKKHEVPVGTHEPKENDATDSGVQSSSDSGVSQTGQVSSATTETESRSSTAPDTFIAGSPVSTATSVSISAPKTDGQNEAQTAPVPEPTEPSISAGSPESTISTPLSPAAKAEPAGSASSVKKSWASLLRPDGSPSRLPTSSVQGFSIPAQSIAGPSSVQVSSGSRGREAELLRWLTTGPTAGSTALQIRPRGLVNTGNMCFANAVLQILAYTPPFYRFFAELGKYKGATAGSSKWAGKDVPLVDATVEFLKEFKPKVKESSKDSHEDDDDFSAIDSFIPAYVYDAMKGKSRFDNMGGGQQEDAEEFFGFFLDSIEEELLAISNALTDGTHSKLSGHDRHAPDGDDWMEVGKRNKPIATRSTKSVDSPMARIFGGKFRSILRVPGQRDSVVVEDWRSIKLDIQREQVGSIEDALRLISHPQPVQVSSVTKGGAVVEATQQVFIDGLPTVLVLHLKRFLYDTSAKDVMKVHKQVTYGPELAIPSDAMSPAQRSAYPAKYKLFAVLYHHGTSAAGGHYTLDVLHPNRNADASAKVREGWIRIDDELVSDLRTEDVFGKDRDSAYLLFYRRIGGGSGSYARAARA